MGDKDECNPGFALQAFQFDLHFLAQLQIQRGQGLIQQQNLGMRRQRTGQRDALLLTTRQLIGASVGQLFHLHQGQHLFHGILDFGLGLVQHFQTKGDILCHRHMGKQGIVLKHGVDWPLIGRQVSDFLTIQQNGPLGGQFKTGDQAQQGCLSTARRAQQGEKLILPDRHRYIVQGGDSIIAAAKGLGHVFRRDHGLPRLFPGRFRCVGKSACLVHIKVPC